MEKGFIPMFGETIRLWCTVYTQLMLYPILNPYLINKVQLASDLYWLL